MTLNAFITGYNYYEEWIDGGFKTDSISISMKDLYIEIMESSINRFREEQESLIGVISKKQIILDDIEAILNNLSGTNGNDTSDQAPKSNET